MVIVIYSTYEFHIMDKHTLCINTDVNIEDILKQINNKKYKEYIKTNINNILYVTPNDFKLLPIKIN